ncbi:MAG: sodium:calcium antiporter [Clostridium sp.]|nr:sodium:calcium antiporter [Clostridium sp.]
MIYLIYLVLAAIVVFLSIKASVYVDQIDKNTEVSGAFIGGVLLSAVTSLPELFTTISSTVWLDNPGLSLGNVLGSNLFNTTIIAVMILFGVNSFKSAEVSRSHAYSSLVTLLIYVVIYLNMVKILDFEILTINIVSIVILILYILGVKLMSNDDSVESEEEQEAAITENFNLKQVIIKFVFASIGIVASSILITYVTDIIAVRLNLGASLAGALLLGIATSLPELTSCISLAKIGNFNVAIGNIVGSNLFNFFILFVADLLYISGSIYNFNDAQSWNLVIYGLLSNLLILAILNSKKRVKSTFFYILCSLGILASYFLFMIA